MLQVLIGLTAGLAAPFIAAGAGAVVGASGMGRVLMSGWLLPVDLQTHALHALETEGNVF